MSEDEETMDEVAFQDWPGPPVDINSGNNPWMPAYGFQTPSALLEKEDFIGNPDADYFLHGTAAQFAYLETIQEETSDDLRSDSGSRNSPVGWLATDSEDGSVICLDQFDDADTESEREIACPPKRRKQETGFANGGVASPQPEDDQDETSLSRSSSLLQFETLEKQCQQESQTSSPSVHSQFSFDSLELANAAREFRTEYDHDIFRQLGRTRESASRDSLLYNASVRSGSSSSSRSSSGSDSDTTVENSRSCDNLKTWRSLDNLLPSPGAGTKKFSSENLSEDSGYGDQLLGTLGGTIRGSRPPGSMAFNRSETKTRTTTKEKKGSYVGFGAYDCDVNQHFNGNFGVSYQDLSIFANYDPFSEPLSKSSPLTDAFLRKKHARQLLNANNCHQNVAHLSVVSGQHDHRPYRRRRSISPDLNLDLGGIGYSESSPKFSVPHAASVPDLFHVSAPPSSVDVQDATVTVSSVPKDLNLLHDDRHGCVAAPQPPVPPPPPPPAPSSVAEKDWNLADAKLRRDEPMTMTTNYKREGSYSEAMTNRVDLSDDENSLFYKKVPKTPIVDFDRRVLKAISEQSLADASLHGSQKQLEKVAPPPPPPKRYQNRPSSVAAVAAAVSTPDLNRIEPAVAGRENRAYFDDDRRKSTQEISSSGGCSSRFDTSQLEEERNKNIILLDEVELARNIERKGSIIKSSTSTSGMSDIDDKTLGHSVKSFTGSSNGSKGVHFSPVVAEVNWQDDASTSTVTPDRESLYSLNSTSPEPARTSPKPKLVKPRAQYARPASRRSVSQPDLSDGELKLHKREFIDSLYSLRGEEVSKSQPDVSKFKRRGSQLVKKDKDGCTIKAYIDTDGIQYRHTHLDLKSLSQTSLTGSNTALNANKQQNSATTPIQKTGSKNNLHTSKFPFYTTNRYEDNNDGDETPTKHHQQHQSIVGDAMGERGGIGGATSVSSSSSTTTKRKNKSGLGGFLQRLASFRLGAKKGHHHQQQQQQQDQKDKHRSGGGTTTPATVQQSSAFVQHGGTSAGQSPSYIYIPLKGPPSVGENNNAATIGAGAAMTASKPPLPKQPPPRVVHASVKKATQASSSSNGYYGPEERRRRRTIDSASSGGVGVGTRNVGNASMDGPMGLIETDLDTEVTVITNGAGANKARSLLDLGAEPRLQLLPQGVDGPQNSAGRPHKSMEFLLDKQNLKVVEPPENELQKTERVMSEHELRVQRSLQKLTVPDWYKNSSVPAQGFLLKKNHAAESSRWTGTHGSRATSLSSLGSGTQSPLVLSPTPSGNHHHHHPLHQQQQQQPFVRWSTSKLNSTASSPCQSTRSSFNQGRQHTSTNGSLSPSSARSSFSYRQPYLGWRSQERLNRQPRTPAERLASTLLGAKQPQQETTANPEIQTSIKEVTSAIVHYVSGLKPTNDADDLLGGGTVGSRRSSSVSPRGSQKLCWLESSFVGTKPTDSPETPVTCSESPVPPANQQSLRFDLRQPNHSSNDLATMSGSGTARVRPSPSSTTLEDVLDSLLGLPHHTGRPSSPCLQETASASTSPQRRRSSDADRAYRRRSEGSEPAAVAVATDAEGATSSAAAPPPLRCRNTRCGKTAAAASKEAKSFKNCHNCSYSYCSRACRRDHWERHRKTCLFSRMGALCRQVIQAVRDQKDTLKVLSTVARRGYIAHGSGAVKCFYPNPEAVEKFLRDGLQSPDELTFVRWQDLLPTEMGPLLYKELVEMCQNYNPETKFVLYISLCVVSETPASGAVKWERQLVSRCAKLRLSKDLDLIAPEREIAEPPETLILTCPPIRLPTPETSKRARLIAFNNVQAQLADRGVSLKRQYPELYRQMDAYCEDLSVRLEPQTIYPRDSTTNKSFMCIVMLESDSDTLRHVEKAGVRVRTVDCLLSCETTTTTL